MADSRTPGLPCWCALSSSSQMLCANALARVTPCGLVIDCTSSKLRTPILQPFVVLLQQAEGLQSDRQLLGNLNARPPTGQSGPKHRVTQHAAVQSTHQN